MNRMLIAKELVRLAREMLSANMTFTKGNVKIIVKRKPSTDEWVARYFVDGKYNEDASYYTDDKQDAIDTAKHMIEHTKSAAIAANDEMQEEDIAIEDLPRGGYNVGVVGGKHLGHFNDRDDAENFIKRWMKKEQFFPTVWFVDDHGGAEPIRLASTKTAGG